MNAHQEIGLDDLARLRRQLLDLPVEGHGGRGQRSSLSLPSYFHTGGAPFVAPYGAAPPTRSLEASFTAQQYDSAMDMLRQLSEEAPDAFRDVFGLSPTFAHDHAATTQLHSFTAPVDGLAASPFGAFRHALTPQLAPCSAQHCHVAAAHDDLCHHAGFGASMQSLATLCAEAPPAARLRTFDPPGVHNLMPAPRPVQTGATPRAMPCATAALPPRLLDRDAVATCTVLAAKALTGSDIKHSRAILPRVAVENNLPFVIGYRTYGLRMPDGAGNEWEVVLKSWANGRSESAPLHQKRRRDRRVFVLEGIAGFLKAHKLQIGDVFGIVVDGDKLALHHRSAALNAWAERPTYGAPAIDVSTQVVHAKCARLEGAALASMTEQCARSAACQKPSGHTDTCFASGMLVGTPPCLQEAASFTSWPPPVEWVDFAGDDAASSEELTPAHLLEGPVLYVRLVAEDVASGLVHMSPGAAIKVPRALARAAALRLAVSTAHGCTHVVCMRMTPEPKSPDEVGSPACRMSAWRIDGLAPIMKALQAQPGDELCLCKEGGTIVAHNTPNTATHPVLPASLVFPIEAAAFGMRLCDRCQGCMKPLQHTGFCSGQKGVKRKSARAPLAAQTCKGRRRTTHRCKSRRSSGEGSE